MQLFIAIVGSIIGISIIIDLVLIFVRSTKEEKRRSILYEKPSYTPSIQEAREMGIPVDDILHDGDIDVRSN